jgi:hypothetical protein
MKKIAVLLFMLAGVLLADQNGNPTPPPLDGTQPFGNVPWNGGSIVPYTTGGTFHTTCAGAACLYSQDTPMMGVGVTCVYNNAFVGVQYQVNYKNLYGQGGRCNYLDMTLSATVSIYWQHTQGYIKDQGNNPIRYWYYWTNCDFGTEETYYDFYYSC